MNKKFLLGMITGLLIAVLAVGGTYAGLMLSGNLKTVSVNSLSGTSVSSSASASGSSTGVIGSYDSDETSKEVFDTKLDLILNYIDRYFMGDADREEIYDTMLHSMLEALDDPYTMYFSPSEFDDLTTSSEGNYCGIGATVSQDRTTLSMYIIYPYENSPAKEAGLQYMDEIVAVDGQDVTGWALDDVVALLRGEAGTDVTLTVLRDGERLDFLITRRQIELEYVVSEMLDDNIGYVMVTSFANVTPGQFKTAIDELVEQGMQALIIDLRDNGGGMLDACTEMLDLFTDKGDVLVYIEDKEGNQEYTYAENKASYSLPTVILVNGSSASASEVFSGCMQAHGLATVIGTQTYGKGVVQVVIPLSVDGSGIKLTAWKYYTPADVCIHGIGITPDIVVEQVSGAESEDGSSTGSGTESEDGSSTGSSSDAGAGSSTDEDKDEQLEAAIEYLKGELAE